MSPKIFIDTQYVVALVNQQDQFHRQAHDLADQLDGQPLLATDAVLVEIGNSLSRRFRREAAQIIREFLQSDDIEVAYTGPDVFAVALEPYRSREDKSWGLTDCISFVVMQRYGVRRALTNDRHFVQAGFEALIEDDQ